MSGLFHGECHHDNSDSLSVGVCQYTPLRDFSLVLRFKTIRAVLRDCGPATLTIVPRFARVQLPAGRANVRGHELGPLRHVQF